MACGQASVDSSNVDCSPTCWQASGTTNGGNGPAVRGDDQNSETAKCTRATSNDLIRRNSSCDDNCTNGCAACYDGCTAACKDGCSSGCSSGCQGCRGCGGACSSSCSGCSGECKGGCQGSCNGKCNTGCSNEEQVNNSKVILDRIVNVDNVKDIFKFVLYEIKRRNKSANTSTINKLSAWTPEDEAKLFLLFYNLPRLFEDTFDSVNKDVKKQSSTLVYEMGEWVSKYLNKS